MLKTLAFLVLLRAINIIKHKTGSLLSGFPTILMRTPLFWTATQCVVLELPLHTAFISQKSTVSKSLNFLSLK